MKVYVAALIDKSMRSSNVKLQKNLISDCRRLLHVPQEAVSIRELNSFVILSGEKSGFIDQKVIDEIERGSFYRVFRKYCMNNNDRIEKELKNDQELQETSDIVKDFIKEIDPNLVKHFDAQMKKILKELPANYLEVQVKSYIVLWDLDETKQYRIFLSGFNAPVFTGSTSENQPTLSGLIEVLLIANFFATFSKYTTKHLKQLDRVLERLKLGIGGTHYKTTNQKLQKKLEMLLRILGAKLSALHDMDNLISRIFELFKIPYNTLAPMHFKNESIELEKTLTEITAEIENGKTLLSQVHEKLSECQLHLRDYLDEQKNGIKTVKTIEEFRNALLPMAELSTDLFIEAELLKVWTDFFGFDIPYFRFNTQHLVTIDSEVSSNTNGNIITVRGLYKNYNLGRTTVYALRGVDLDVREGEFLAIVGNSGAGKTTLLNCMAGLDTPDHGVVLFRGKNLHKMDDAAKSKVRLLEMGFIFQSYALLPHFNTRENIALPADLAGFSKELKERIEELLKGVGLSNQAEQFPATLSGGQMQRVAIARALINRPAVIFADEPTGDLDSVTGKQVMDLLKKFHEETKTTIILITHEKDVASYAERQIVLEDGMIVHRQ
ncbi:MAG: ABC transporter ATP-binding protein [Candidatus Bathyarchaeia archaeon]